MRQLRRNIDAPLAPRRHRPLPVQRVRPLPQDERHEPTLGPSTPSAGKQGLSSLGVATNIAWVTGVVFCVADVPEQITKAF